MRTRQQFMNSRAACAMGPVLAVTSYLASCTGFVGEGPAGSESGRRTAVSNEGPGAFLTLPGNSNADAGASGEDAAVPAVRDAGADSGARTNGANQTTPAAGELECEAQARRAEGVLTTYCAGCHGASSSAKGGFSTVLDVSALISSGKVVKNRPEMSLLWQRMSAASMPPADVLKRPNAADVETIRAWIECGALDWEAPAANATAFVTIDDRLRTVFDDLRAIPNPTDRERQRYFDLTTLSNAGISVQQLTTYRNALAFLTNSLSRGQQAIPPVAVDDAELIYRIDLRDYEWDATTWDQLEATYPYAVIYDQDSRLFPFDEATAEQIREETGTEIPIIQADWFISHASRPPLYHTLLDLPDSLPQLEQQLGIDIQRDIDTEQVLRAGFANAVPSQNNRVIERHELGGNRGALWVSYDFATGVADQNIFANPLDFEADSHAVIFNLDNGLQAYFLADAAGRRIDKAPNAVLQDQASRDGAVENGLSCMGCHLNDGALPKYDEIRDFQLQAGADAQEIEAVIALYVSREELSAAFDEDQNRYRTARSTSGGAALANATLHALDDAHLGILNIEAVGSVVGLSRNQLQRAIDASPQAFPPEIVTLRTNGGGIQRDSFDTVVGDLIEALGLGRQLRVSRNNVPRQAPPAPAAGSGATPAKPAPPPTDAETPQPPPDAGHGDAGFGDAGFGDAGFADAGAGDAGAQASQPEAPHAAQSAK
jgi:Planctomycete cytochrome C